MEEVKWGRWKRRGLRNLGWMCESSFQVKEKEREKEKRKRGCKIMMFGSQLYKKKKVFLIFLPLVFFFLFLLRVFPFCFNNLCYSSNDKDKDKKRKPEHCFDFIRLLPFSFLFSKSTFLFPSLFFSFNFLTTLY